MLLLATLWYVLSYKQLDALEELKKFSLTAQTAQTIEFMLSNVAYRATVYKTGTAILQYVVQ